MEDDYGMIDGIVNNGKADRIKEAEEQRPSVLEQLKAGVNPTAAFMRRRFGVGPAGIAPNEAKRGAQGPEEVGMHPS